MSGRGAAGRVVFALTAAAGASLAVATACGTSGGSATPPAPAAIYLDRDPIIVTGVVGQRTRYELQIINKGGVGLTVSGLALEKPNDGGFPRPIDDGGSFDQPILFVDAGSDQFPDGGDAGNGDAGNSDAGNSDAGNGDAGNSDAGADAGYLDPGPTAPGDVLPVVIGGVPGFVHFDFKPTAVGTSHLVLSIDSSDPARPHVTSAVTACAQLPDGGGASTACSCYDGGC